MQTGRARPRHSGRHLMVTVGLGLALFTLLLLAMLSVPPSAGAYISGTVPTPVSNVYHSGVSIKFQAPSSAGVDGLLPDIGEVYSNRGNGYTYGWNRDNTAATFDRNVSFSEAYDTGIQINDDPNATSGTASKWEIELPAGWYQVMVCVGDLSLYDSIYSIQAEGVTAIHKTASSSNRSFLNYPIVRVTDGRLTINSAVGAYKNKLLFLHVMPLSSTLRNPLFYKTRINFQPATSAPVENYMSDTGQVYGARGSNWSYGWSVDNSAWMVDRNSALSADQRYDTFAYLRKDSVSRTWEMAVTEGWYWVTIAAGEASAESGTLNSIKAEGVLVTYQDTNDTRTWVEGHAAVFVSDGKLTVTSSGSSTTHTKINFIEVSQGERNAYDSANVAMGKKARQSSNHQTYYAWRAVDGSAASALGGGSVAMTGSALESFWEVDLGAVYDLESITLSPRDANQTRVDNYYILVSDDPFSSTSLNTAKSHVGVSSYYQSEPLMYSTEFEIGRTGRYIRVQLTGTNYLHLAEVVADARLPSGNFWQAAASSSAVGLPPINGIDLDIATFWRSAGLQTSGMYYKLDLRGPETFSKLTLEAGTTSGYPRAYEVYVTNDSAVYSSSTASWGSPVASGTPSANPVVITFAPQHARYIMAKLTQPASTVWQIQELTVSP